MAAESILVNQNILEARRRREAAAAAKTTTLNGPSAGGVPLQPATTVNSQTGQKVTTPAPTTPSTTTTTSATKPTGVNQSTTTTTTTPVTTPPAVAPTPKPVAATPTTPPASQPFAGIDETALKASGITDDQIAKMKAILSPSLEANANVEKRAGELYTKTTADLEEEQRQTEALYGDVKARKEQLANESLQINDQSAEVQKMLSDQQYQQTKFLNEQAKAQFELDANRAERDRQTQNDENEASLRRAIGAQLGASFSSEGLNVMLKEKSRGAALIDDLRAQNAIGKAEFSFKAMDIEKDYYNSLKSIESDRASKSLTIKSNLDQDLTDIDEQILLSRNEKKQAARDAMKNYYDQLNTVELDSASKTTDAVNQVYEDKKALEKEKLDKETFDVGQSTALGFYANKYGQPIGIPEGGQPKPFVGSYDETLSKQFGYLVDSQGHAIKGTNGQNISYRDPDLIAFQNALSGYQSGNYNQSNLSALNFKLGNNVTISNTLENGKAYTSPKYGSLQCGEYINDQFLASRMLGSDFANADALISKYGGKPGAFAPQVGDVVFMNTGDPNIPHKAIVEGMDEQGNLILTDANYVGAGVVRHGWKIAVGDANYKNIYGFARLPLNDKTKGGQPMMTPNVNGTDNRGAAGDSILDNFVISYEDYQKMKPEEKRMLAAQGYSDDKIQKYFEDKDKGPQTQLDETDTGWATTAIDNAFGDAEGGKAAKRKQEEFQTALSNGKYKDASVIAQAAVLKGASAKQKSDILASKQLTRNLGGIQDALDEYEKAGKELGLVNATVNDIQKKLGQERPEQLVNLESKLNGAFAAYIKSLSGASVSEQEVARLQTVFPTLQEPIANFRQKLTNNEKAAQLEYDDLVNQVTNGQFASMQDYQDAIDSIANYKSTAQKKTETENFNKVASVVGEKAKGLASLFSFGGSSSPAPKQSVSDDDILNALK